MRDAYQNRIRKFLSRCRDRIKFAEILATQNQISRGFVELRAPCYCVGLLFEVVISRREISRELPNLGLREI